MRIRHLASALLSLLSLHSVACTQAPTAATVDVEVVASDTGADSNTAEDGDATLGPDAPDSADVQPYDGHLTPVILADPPTTHVDPRIGTGGSGNVFFGVTAPHNMLKVGPDTDNGGQDIKGYQWDATRITAFSHTHLDGPGGSAYGYSQIALLPTMGTPTFVEDKYAATFTHSGEVAEPAYYAVTLTDHQIRAELTASQHCAWHRYSFPAGTARVLLDLGHTRGISTGGHLEVGAAGHLSGRGDYNVHPAVSGLLADKAPVVGLVSVFADVTFLQPPVRTGLFQEGKALTTASADGPALGGWAEWDLPTPATVDVHACISFLSAERAAAHRTKELGTATFAGLRSALNSEWNALLSRVKVSTPDSIELARFYTALYHSLLQPANYTEDGEFWNGSKVQAVVQKTGGRQFYTDDWCVWDTARTVHPLLTLMQPEVVGDMLQSMLWQTGEEGYLSKCTWQATGDSRVMTGNFTFCLYADALTKGLDNFDQDAALKTMELGATTETDNPGAEGLCGYLNQGTPPFYRTSGWVPAECDLTQGASMTLEHAYSDWCLGQYASAMGKTALATEMHARGGNWKHTWGPHNYPQLRNEDGTWWEPFDPAGTVGFTEATAWIYQWFVPHDRCGLVTQLGGKSAARVRLDEFFDGGHFDMGNEPDFHAPWFYHDLGRPDLSADRVRSLAKQHFTTAPGGLPGNDDAGAMSAWLVLAAVGLYPVAPGDSMYAITPPFFAQTSLQIGANTVRVSATGPLSTGHIATATWNGVLLDKPWISHQQLATGGELELTLTEGPTTWGTSGCPQ